MGYRFRGARSDLRRAFKGIYDMVALAQLREIRAARLAHESREEARRRQDAKARRRNRAQRRGGGPWHR